MKSPRARGRRAAPTLGEAMDIQDYVTEAEIPAGSPAIDETVAQFRARHDHEVTVTAILRAGIRSTPFPDTPLKPEDLLILAGAPDALERVIAADGLELEGQHRDKPEGSGREVGVLEAVIGTDSPLIGRTAGRLGLHERFGVNLIAVSRQGERLATRLGDIELSAGDVIVLQLPNGREGFAAFYGALQELVPVRGGDPAVALALHQQLLAGLHGDEVHEACRPSGTQHHVALCGEVVPVVVLDAGTGIRALGASLDECRKRQNQNRDLVAAVQLLQRSGLEVMGGFIVGFDSDKSDIFEARLLPFGDKLHFSNAFVFHPKEVKKFVVSELKAFIDADMMRAGLSIVFVRDTGDRRIISNHDTAWIDGGPTAAAAPAR